MRWAAIAAAVLAACGCAAAAAADGTREWVFDAYIDGRPIGEHRFSATTAGDRTTVVSRARFEVKVMGFVAYHYRQDAEEVWRGDCLESVRARTDDDGKALKVDADIAGGALQVVSARGTAALPGCVMGFAYWSPAIRQQARLLNVQTGDYVPVAFAALPDQAVEVRGRPVAARHWKVDGPENPLELWYSPEGDWLGLEFSVSGGRKLRYRLR